MVSGAFGIGHPPVRQYRGSRSSSLSKEDFLPHTYESDPDTFFPVLNGTYAFPSPRAYSPAQAAFSIPSSRRATPVLAPMIYPYPATVPQMQSPRPVMYPIHHLYSGPAPLLPPLPQLPNMATLFRTATSMTPSHSRAPLTHQYVPQRARHSLSVSTSGYTTFGPRPGRGEQQSTTRASLNEQLLQQQLARLASPRLPPGVSERRRWERCVT